MHIGRYYFPEPDKKTTRIMALGVFFTMLIFFSAKYFPENFVYNHTPSIPTGLYKLNPIDHVERGETILFDYKSCCKDKHPDILMVNNFIKRAAGIPGDKLYYEGEELVLETRTGETHRYYIQPRTPDGIELKKIEAQTIPSGYFFMAGDIKQSFDSRYYGLVNQAFMLKEAEPLYLNDVE